MISVMASDVGTASHSPLSPMIDGMRMRQGTMRKTLRMILMRAVEKMDTLQLTGAKVRIYTLFNPSFKAPEIHTRSKQDMLDEACNQ